jgi:hypothetical protein
LIFRFAEAKQVNAMRKNRKITMKTFEAIQTRKKLLSPMQFVKLSDNQREFAAIKSATFIAPKPGARGFGKFLVERRKPIWVMSDVTSG